MFNLPPHELYAQKQFRHNLGYALFDPDPCSNYDRVRVGDVGYVSDGMFMRLFNAFHEADSPVNQGATLPDNFMPIGETFRALDGSHSLPAGPMTSERVRALALGPNTPVAAGTKMKLQCEPSSSGAALLLHYPANREKAFADKAMEDYIVANHAEWLAMVREQGSSLQLNDLIFVRDCTLTGDWATMVWDEVSFNPELDFNIDTANVADASLSIWGAWEDQVSASKLQGPVGSDRNREAYERREFDQCIFLKGLRVSIREWYETLLSIMKVKNAEDGGFDIDPAGPTVLRFLKKVGFEVETTGSRPSTFRPVQNCYDLMAIFIFENSDADIAVVDDNDVNVFDRGQMGSLESMCDALISKGIIRVVISASGEEGKEKVGRISLHGPEPSVYSEQDLIVLDEFNRPLHGNDGMQVDYPEPMRESSDSHGGTSSSDGHAVIHTCESNPDQCPQCSELIALLERNPVVLAELTEALERLSGSVPMEEFV